MRSKMVLGLLVCVVLQAPALSLGQPQLTYGSRPFFGWAYHVEVAGNLAFLGAGNSLLVFDVHAPASPTLLSTVDFTSFVNPIKAIGDTLFVGTHVELSLIDVKNPADPRVIQKFPFGAQSVAVRDSLYLFAAEDLLIYKPSATGELVFVGKYDPYLSVERVAVKGSLAILGLNENIHGEGWLHLVDIGDPAHPQVIWQQFGYNPDHIGIVDSLVFVALLGRIETYEIEARSLRKIDETIRFGAQKFSISGQSMYLATGDAGVVILDISKPDSLRQIGSFTTVGSVQDVSAQDGMAYMADLSNGLSIYNVTTPADAKPVGHFYRTIFTIELVVVEKGLATLSLFPDKASYYYRYFLQTFETTDPYSPFLLSSTDLNYGTSDMFLKDRRLYFAVYSDEGGGIIAYDISNLLAPRRVYSLGTSSGSQGVFAQDSRLFLASQGVRIFEYPSRRPLGEFSIPGTSTEGIYALGDLVFLWGYSNLYVLQISNLPTISLLHEVEVCDVYDIAVRPDTIALIPQCRRLEVVDLSNPDSLVLLASLEIDDQINDIDLDDDWAFLAGNRSCQVLDVSDPSNPRVIYRYEMSVPASRVAFSKADALVYLSGFELGLLVLNFDSSVGVKDSREMSAMNPEIMQNYPNPFNASTIIRYALPKSERVILEVFNLLGERVATLVDERQIAGEHNVQWSGVDLPSGVYVYRIKTGGFVESKKLVLLR